MTRAELVGLAEQSVAHAEAFAAALQRIQEAGGRAQARTAAVSADLAAIGHTTRASLSRLAEGSR